jgi:hypothetical protein
VAPIPFAGPLGPSTRVRTRNHKRERAFLQPDRLDRETRFGVRARQVIRQPAFPSASVAQSDADRTDRRSSDLVLRSFQTDAAASTSSSSRT